MIPDNLTEICQRWRLEAISELTDILGLLISGDFDQNDYCDRIAGLADHARLTTDPSDGATPVPWDHRTPPKTKRPLTIQPWAPPGQTPPRHLRGLPVHPELIDDNTNPEDLSE